MENRLYRYLLKSSNFHDQSRQKQLHIIQNKYNETIRIDSSHIVFTKRLLLRVLIRHMPRFSLIK